MTTPITQGGYSALNLRGWPFNIVPSEETAAVWVGRPEALHQLLMLLRSISRVPASQIILLWAAYGAGKTHALKHLQGLARQHADLLPLYVATPEGMRSFLDVYKAVIDSALQAGTLEAAGRDLFTKIGSPGRTDLERALIRIGTLPLEAQETQTAISWLKADKVSMRDLRDVAITRRLETTAHGVDALNDLIQILQRNGAVKILLLLDEIQEIDQLDSKRRIEAVGGLHKVFDRNTEGLTMLLSFTTASQPQVRRIIGDALFDRRSEILALPPISLQEGVELVEGLISEWSIDPKKSPFPFERESINAVVERIAAENRLLTPREVIRAFNAILRQALFDLEDGRIAIIDTSYAVDRLATSLSELTEDE